MFDKLKTGLEHLEFYNVLSCGYDYEMKNHPLDGFDYVSGLHFWAMLKEPILENNSIFSLLIDLGWWHNNAGNIWKLYQ
jgi:hypothetical protein